MELKLGIFWTVFCTLLFGTMILAFMQAISFFGIGVIIFLGFMALLFESIGIALIVAGIKKIYKEKTSGQTSGQVTEQVTAEVVEQKGTLTYGKILEISPSGTFENGNRGFKASILVYLNDEGTVREFVESIGFTRGLYRRGEFLLVKQYKEKINIIREANVSEINENIMKFLGYDDSPAGEW